MRVRDILKLSAELRKKNCTKEAKDLCERLQLDTTRKVEELSFGNRKKVGIVCALQHDPKLLVLDEPTNHLDVDAKEELKRALLDYKGSILMVCHEPEFYEGLATSIWDGSAWTTRL